MKENILKTCTQCGKTKNVSEFYEMKYNSIIKNNRRVWIGPQWTAKCSECIRKNSREYLRKRRENQPPRSPEKRREEYRIRCLKNGQTHKNGMKFVFEFPIGNLRKCTRCKEYRPSTRFTRTTRNKSGFLTICKDCNNKRYHEKYEPKPRKKTSSKTLKRRAKTRSFLNGFFEGDGCCLYCGECNPWMLNNHHPWKEEDPNFTVTLCENHHAPFTRGAPFILDNWN